MKLQTTENINGWLQRACKILRRPSTWASFAKRLFNALVICALILPSFTVSAKAFSVFERSVAKSDHDDGDVRRGRSLRITLKPFALAERELEARTNERAIETYFLKRPGMSAERRTAIQNAKNAISVRAAPDFTTIGEQIRMAMAEARKGRSPFAGAVLDELERVRQKIVAALKP